MSEKYDECPLKAAGFTLHYFHELVAQAIGPDGRCVCTKDQRCQNPDKRGQERCTLEELKILDREAVARRAWQSGWD